MPRRGDRAQLPDEVAVVETPCAGSVGERSISWRKDGRLNRYAVNPHNYRCALLASELADEAIAYIRRAMLSAGSGERHVAALKGFCSHVDEVSPLAASLTLAGGHDEELIELLASWQLALKRRYAPTSQHPRAMASAVLIQVVEYGVTHRTNNSMLQLYAQAGTTLQRVVGSPLDEFTAGERVAMEAAAKKSILAAEIRIAIGKQRAAQGIDPEVGGWLNVDNLLHRSAGRLLTSAELAAHLPATWKGLTPEIRTIIGRRGPSGKPHNVGWSPARLAEGLASMLMPTISELMSYRVLLGLRLGVAPEELLGLTASDVNVRSDAVEVKWTKARALRIRRVSYRTRKTQQNDAFEERETTEEGRRRFDARHVFAGLIEATAIPRAQYPDLDPPLWLSHHQTRIMKPLFGRTGSFVSWLKVHGIAVNGPIDLRRLRKTHKTVRAIALGGVLSDVADDHTVSVFRNHYMHSTTLNVMAGKVVNRVQERILERTAGPLVVIGEAKDLREESTRNSLDLTAQQVERLIDGDLDVGIAACRNVMESPFATKGTLCPVAPARCLVCPNALVAEAHLPRLLRFVDHLNARRLELTPHAWEAVWGSTWRNLVEGILTEFPEAALQRAREAALAIELDLPLGMKVEFER